MAKYSGSGWHRQSVRHSNARKYGRAGGTYAIGKRFHIDTDFEGRRLVDNVEIYSKPQKKDRKVLIYSPYLRANILLPKKELKTEITKEPNKRKHTTRGELYDKVRDALYKESDSGDVPEYLEIRNKNKIIIKAEEWEGAGIKKVEITPEDIIRYYKTQAGGMSGVRTLAGFSTDWRMVDNMAKESLEIFKIINPERLRTLAKRQGMTPKF